MRSEVSKASISPHLSSSSRFISLHLMLRAPPFLSLDPVETPAPVLHEQIELKIFIEIRSAVGQHGLRHRQDPPQVLLQTAEDRLSRDRRVSPAARSDVELQVDRMWPPETPGDEASLLAPHRY